MDSLLEVLRGVTLDPGEQAAFSADPQGYLAQHGYEGVPDEDVAEAFSLVADTLPADVVEANPFPTDALNTASGEEAFGQGVDTLGPEAEADPMGDVAFGEGSSGFAGFDEAAADPMDDDSGFDDQGFGTSDDFGDDLGNEDFASDDLGNEDELVHDDFVDADEDFSNVDLDDGTGHAHGHDDLFDDTGSF